jgi:hypothetical protein
MTTRTFVKGWPSGSPGSPTLKSAAKRPTSPRPCSCLRRQRLGMPFQLIDVVQFRAQRLLVHPPRRPTVFVAGMPPGHQASQFLRERRNMHTNPLQFGVRTGLFYGFKSGPSRPRDIVHRPGGGGRHAGDLQPSSRATSMTKSQTDAGKQAAKVLIVDDHSVVRERLAIRISRQPDLEVCGEAADVAQALQLSLPPTPTWPSSTSRSRPATAST